MNKIENQSVIAEIAKNNRTKIVLRKYSVNGKEFVDIREFFPAKGNDWAPTGKGISINKNLLGEVLDALAGQEAK